jgi:hypothetical protein
MTGQSVGMYIQTGHDIFLLKLPALYSSTMLSLLININTNAHDKAATAIVNFVLQPVSF